MLGVIQFFCMSPANIYLCKVNIRNKCLICSKLTIKARERRHCFYCSILTSKCYLGVLPFIIIFCSIQHQLLSNIENHWNKRLPNEWKNFLVCFILISIGPLVIIGSALKRGSVHPSVCLSRFFLGIGSLVFSKFWLGIKNPFEVMLDKAGFSEKKWGK